MLSHGRAAGGEQGADAQTTYYLLVACLVACSQRPFRPHRRLRFLVRVLSPSFPVCNWQQQQQQQHWHCLAA